MKKYSSNGIKLLFVLYFIPFFFKVLYVAGSDLSSLTFIIDDTSSMWDDIAEVMHGANAIFETVKNNKNDSQIDNFILVTFNDRGPYNTHTCTDPGIIIRKKTKDRDSFKMALASIIPNGGAPDCAECSMAGIIRGVDESLPKSSVYVFTDATAKDYNRFEEVKRIAQTKECQIVFVLTGNCRETDYSPKYKVYQDVAAATGGAVFDLNKGEVNKVLEYVKKTITGRRTTLTNTDLPAGVHSIPFTADALMGEIVLSFASSVASDPTVHVKAPDGSEVPKEIVFHSAKAKAYAVNVTKQGNYTVEVESAAATRAVITAKSGVEFEHGFSAFKLSSIEDTSTRPAPGVKSHLSIKLNTGNVTLKSIQILDMDGNVKLELPLHIENNETKFYTTDAFDPPVTMFKIAIVGYDAASGSDITRDIPTPVETHKPILGALKRVSPVSNNNVFYNFTWPKNVWYNETFENKLPSVTKIGDPVQNPVNVNYDERLELICYVEGYPEPDIVWTNKDKGTVFTNTTLSGKTIPYEHIKVLTIDKITESATYSCAANNSLGSDSKQVAVEVIRRKYLNITYISENATVTYGKKSNISCTVDAYPPANITWYKNDVKFTPSSVDIEIETKSNSSIVFLNNSTLTDEGKYSCEARNEDTKQSADMYVTVLVPATITTSKNFNKSLIVGVKKSTLPCKATGKPKPEIQWIYKSFNGSVLPLDLPEENTTQLMLQNINMTHEGNYTCIASNSVGTSNITYSVHVFDYPEIERSNETKVSVEKGSSTVLNCKILKGKPKPSITWWFRLGEGYKDSPETFKEVIEWKDKESIHVKNAKKNNTGTYQCQAQNTINEKNYTDHIEKNLVVEYKPEILIDKTKDKAPIKANVGLEVAIPCVEDGSPPSNVTWFKDGVELVNDGKPYIFGFQVLTFAAKLSHSGNYNCTAKNKLGSDSKSVIVVVTEPATIVIPPNKTFAALVGGNVNLACEAKGDPKPSLKWTYKSFSAVKLSDKIFKNTTNLQLNHIQAPEEGYYTCTALNDAGSMNLTYEVQVFAPPAINNMYKEKRFVVVEGDIALQIDCNATGNPRPTVTWTKDGSNISLGSTYSVKNGTLTIANIPEDASGSYTCEVNNPRGIDNVTYEIVVQKYPTVHRTASTTIIELEKTAEINCPVPHNSTDPLRWYKNGALIHNGVLSIKNASLSDSGVYICRVSIANKSYSNAVQVDVGYRPTFQTYSIDEDVDIIKNMPISLNCETYGNPEGNVTWYHDGITLNSTAAVNFFPKGLSGPGEYKCEVNNKYGTISRTFNATQNFCEILSSALVLMNRVSPLLLNANLTWLVPENSHKNIVLPKGEQVIWFCPSGFNKFPKQQYATGYCVGGANFSFERINYDYKDIKCTEELKHVANKTGKKCMPGNTEKIKVGYKVNDEVDPVVYEICLNTTNEIPIYAKHTLQTSFADNEYDVTWSDGENFRTDFGNAYNCLHQVEIIMRWLERYFHHVDLCCFKKRQLVSPRDVFPGIPQKSTYSYYNAVPQWSTCHVENWDEVEKRVRNLVKTLNSDLLVWTGTAKELSIETIDGAKNIFISNKLQSVPLYLWKVIQDPSSESSLAIIQVNVPDLDPSIVRRYILCEDLCDITGWMDNTDWHDVKKGYIYCCSIEEFENAFGFKGIFEPDMDIVLISDD